MATENDDDRRHRLAVIAHALGEEVASLRAAETQHSEALHRLRVEIEKKTWKTTIKIRWMIVLVVLDLILSGGMLVGYLKITDLLEDREIVRSQVLCPLYRLLLGSYAPESRTPGPDRDKYEANFAAMRDQYAALDCAGPLVPPRSDTPR